MDTAGILTRIPHRYPIMLVDRVTELVEGERLTARKAVTAGEAWYRGEQESFAYPQVLLIESWCQAAGLLITADDANADVVTGNVMLFGGMADIRFHREVFPGDVLEHHVRLVRRLTDVAVLEGESLVDGELVLEVGRVSVAGRPMAELTGELTGVSG